MNEQFYRINNVPHWRLGIPPTMDLEVDVLLKIEDNMIFVSLDNGTRWRSVEIQNPEETILEYAQRAAMR